MCSDHELTSENGGGEGAGPEGGGTSSKQRRGQAASQSGAKWISGQFDRPNQGQ